ncbi:MAG: B12-binding domain-containing protein [Pyrinomonadaceae bacterium]
MKSAASPQQLFEALIAGRIEEAASLLVNAYLHGHSLAALFDETVSTAMRRIGELWYKGELTIAQEHIATRTALEVLHTLRRIVEVPEENGLLAICCSVEADFHELPIGVHPNAARKRRVASFESWTQHPFFRSFRSNLATPAAISLRILYDFN